MRNKPDIDRIDIDDLYNNLRVYEHEMKTPNSSQSLAFLSSGNTNSTNKVSTASSDFVMGYSSGSSSISSDTACSFLAQPTSNIQLENEDLKQLDRDDLEELDIRWQIAMVTVRAQNFMQRTGRKMDFKENRSIALDKSKVECYNCHRKGHFARECRSEKN
ncbi:retrovirus-related pol polyprotein from transposon TNT 1-94, partial [Tanacetum coccineum]